MKVRALRGVCVGVDKHLKVNETATLDAQTTQFLISIRAVEPVPDEPTKPVEPVPAAPLKTELPAKPKS